MTLLVSVWGKGGVGKSTIAAALALELRSRLDRVLLVSTDPSPAASRLLCRAKTATPTVCRGVELWEVSIEEARRRWIERFGDEVYEVVSSFLPLEKNMVLEHIASIPGIVDEYMLYCVYEAYSGKEFDAIVWDTVAAGGSIRLLRLEHEFYTHMNSAARIYLRVRSTLEKIRRSGGARDALELIDSWRRLAEEILAMLSSPKHTALVVAEPSRLAATVARQVVEELRASNIPLAGIVLNKTLDKDICPSCPLTQQLLEASRASRVELETLGLPVYKIPYIPAGDEEVVEGIRDTQEFKLLLEKLTQHHGGKMWASPC